MNINLNVPMVITLIYYYGNQGQIQEREGLIVKNGKTKLYWPISRKTLYLFRSRRDICPINTSPSPWIGHLELTIFLTWQLYSSCYNHIYNQSDRLLHISRQIYSWHFPHKSIRLLHHQSLHLSFCFYDKNYIYNIKTTSTCRVL